MIRPIFLLSLVLIGSACLEQKAASLSRIAGLPAAERADGIEAYFAAHTRFPAVLNDSTVEFVFRGEAEKVELAGDFSHWESGHFPLRRIPDTDVWFRRQKFEPDARLDYKLVIDSTRWILDPLNPDTMWSGFGPNSELKMPRYVKQPELIEDADQAKGTVWDSTFSSSQLNNSRQISVYLPAAYAQSEKQFPMVLFHDGADYLELGKAKTILDNLIGGQRIQPLIAVFIPPVNRNQEYSEGQQAAFMRFVINEVLARIAEKFRVSPRREDHAVLGVSNGGNISLAMGYFYSDYFGNVGAYSTWVQESLRGVFGKVKKPLKIYLDRGKYDIPVLLPLIDALHKDLLTAGYEFRYHEYNEGHSWGNWRAHLDEALQFFFPGKNSSAPN